MDCNNCVKEIIRLYIEIKDIEKHIKSLEIYCNNGNYFDSIEKYNEEKQSIFKYILKKLKMNIILIYMNIK